MKLILANTRLEDPIYLASTYMAYKTEKSDLLTSISAVSFRFVHATVLVATLDIYKKQHIELISKKI